MKMMTDSYEGDLFFSVYNTGLRRLHLNTFSFYCPSFFFLFFFLPSLPFFSPPSFLPPLSEMLFKEESIKIKKSKTCLMGISCSSVLFLWPTHTRDLEVQATGKCCSNTRIEQAEAGGLAF